ncbi:hypothetical protein AB4488_17830, partial [Vibrio breoganii]
YKNNLKRSTDPNEYRRLFLSTAINWQRIKLKKQPQNQSANLEADHALRTELKIIALFLRSHK